VKPELNARFEAKFSSPGFSQVVKNPIFLTKSSFFYLLVSKR